MEMCACDSIGVDTDESLQWVTFACQRSNVLPAASGPTPHTEILTSLYTSSSSSSQRFQRLETLYLEEKEEIEALSRNIHQEYVHGSRVKLRMYSIYKQGIMTSP